MEHFSPTLTPTSPLHIQHHIYEGHCGDTIKVV